MAPATEERSADMPIAERHPRPEAKALRWKELLPTTQEAMEELICWLEAAVDSGGAQRMAATGITKPDRPEQLATSVLVAGDRGFGKTTILLSLASALQLPGRFLAPVREPNGSAASEPTEDDEEEAQRHPLYKPLTRISERLVLLTPLDMEPLPAEANLLATLLVRVRDALSVAPTDRELERLASPVLLEEGVDEPWGKIDQLVRDATFMWEDIPVQGQDPRQRAEYQLRSAELYANFQTRFYAAIESVCNHLSRRKFGYDTHKGVILVLPIDNVDRSIQHLHQILKLTRMVANRRLWFLLASGRQEFQLFLERTFQEELSHSGKLMAAPDSQDTTLSISRRQAAAAMRRVLPETHRIEIRSLRPEETWEFQAPPSLMDRRRDRKKLHELLESIPLPCALPPAASTAGKAQVTQQRQSLAALFDLQLWLSPEGPKNTQGAPPFTDAARLALTMSARTALDLWQAAGAASERPPSQGSKSTEGDGAAIEIARRMLLMSIDESDLPHWASEQLLHHILRRDREKRTVLDLTGLPIQRQKRTSLSDVLDAPLASTAPGLGKLLRTEVHLRHFQDVILELHALDGSGRTVPLPPSVAGWFMLLHDLLFLTRERRVQNIHVTPLDLALEIVVTQHEVKLQPLIQTRSPPGFHLLAELNVWWIPPEWETFLEFSIFTHQWKTCFIEPHEALLQRPISSAPEALEALFRDCRLRHILAAWVDNVCAVAEEQRCGWAPKLPSWTANLKSPLHKDDVETYRRQVDDYEARVTGRVADLYASSQQNKGHDNRSLIAWRWLKYSLPLMLSPEFLPNAISDNLYQRIMSAPPAPWAGSEELIAQRRGEVVRAVLQRSEALQRYEALLGAGRTTSAPSSSNLLLEACVTWLTCVRGRFEDGAPTPAPTPAPGARWGRRSSQRRGT